MSRKTKRVSIHDMEIISVCEVRYDHSKNCKDCVYYGKECEGLKHYFDNVKRPSEIDLTMYGY